MTQNTSSEKSSEIDYWTVDFGTLFGEIVFQVTLLAGLVLMILTLSLLIVWSVPADLIRSACSLILLVPCMGISLYLHSKLLSNGPWLEETIRSRTQRWSSIVVLWVLFACPDVAFAVIELLRGLLGLLTIACLLVIVLTFFKVFASYRLSTHVACLVILHSLFAGVDLVLIQDHDNSFELFLAASPAIFGLIAVGSRLERMHQRPMLPLSLSDVDQPTTSMQQAFKDYKNKIF